MQQHRLDHMTLESLLTDPALLNDVRSEQLAEFEPLFKAFAELVRQPDYEVDAFAAGLLWDEGDDSDSEPRADYLTVQRTAKLLALQSVILGREGRTADALAAAETVTRAGRIRPDTYLISYVMGLNLLKLGTNIWSRAIEKCDDPTRLAQTLARQNELATGWVRLRRDIPLNTQDWLGALRQLRRLGIVHNTQGCTGRQIEGLYWLGRAEYLEKVVWPKVASDPAQAGKRDKLTRGIDAGRASALIFRTRRPETKNEWLLAGQLYLFPAYELWVVANQATPDAHEIYGRESAALAGLDRLRMETARKLYTLEKGHAPADLAALTPQYLPELPPDPASGEQSFSNLTDAIPDDLTSGTTRKTFIMQKRIDN